MTSTELQDRIVGAAAELLATGGAEAMTTRAVAIAARVQPPAIYRFFAGKQELLDAATGRAFSAYLAEKSGAQPSGDPVNDLRRGWDLHVGFGLAHPQVYAAIYGRQRSGAPSPAERQAEQILAQLVHRIADAGRLRLPEEQAAQLVHATGRGTVLSLINQPAAERDPALVALARESAITAVTTDAAGPDSGHTDVRTAAITLRANLDRLDQFTAREAGLLEEWLDKIARLAQAAGPPQQAVRRGD